MGKDNSFDVVSKVDFNTISECVQVALKEILNRYDFRGSDTTVELDQKAQVLRIQSSDEFKVNAAYDLLATRLAKRQVPLKNFEPEKIESALGGTAKQVVKIIQGIPKDKAKDIIGAIKKRGLKVQASIQGDQLRVTSASRDLLQDTIAFLKGEDFGVDLQFENYR